MIKSSSYCSEVIMDKYGSIDCYPFYTNAEEKSQMHFRFNEVRRSMTPLILQPYSCVLHTIRSYMYLGRLVTTSSKWDSRSVVARISEGLALSWGGR